MSEDTQKKYVLGHTPFKCYRDFIIALVLVLLALLVPYLAFSAYLKPEGEPLNIWFQRSGSIVVLLSLIAEYLISRLHGIIRPAGFTSKATEEIRKKLEPSLMVLRYVGGAVAVGGTLVWGYGDFLV